MKINTRRKNYENSLIPRDKNGQIKTYRKGGGKIYASMNGLEEGHLVGRNLDVKGMVSHYRRIDS